MEQKNRNNKRNQNSNRPNPQGSIGGIRNVSRGAAIRAQKRSLEDANRIASQYMDAANTKRTEEPRRANIIDDQPRLKVTALGGMDGGGSKNMIVIEYMNDA